MTRWWLDLNPNTSSTTRRHLSFTLMPYLKTNFSKISFINVKWCYMLSRFSCKLCEENFILERTLNHHIQTVHSPEGIAALFIWKRLFLKTFLIFHSPKLLYKEFDLYVLFVIICVMCKTALLNHFSILQCRGCDSVLLLEIYFIISSCGIWCKEREQI